jgi:hypothetical protein
MSKNMYAYQKQKLLDHVMPLYEQLNDPQDEVSFTLAVTGKGGPEIPTSNSRLSWSDFMDAAQFNQYATLTYHPETNTFGEYPRGVNAMPIPDFNALLHEVPVKGY